MSTELQKTTNAQLPVAQRAAIALGVTEEKKAELRELAARTTSIVEITNADGYRQVHSARMALKNERINLEKLGKEARQDATNFSKAVIAQEKLAIGIIEPEEQRLQAIQTEHDEAEDREREAKILAEQKRVEAIQARIADIRSPVEFGTRYNTPSSDIAVYIKDTEAQVIDDWFQEFRQQADDAKASTLTKLREAHDAAVSREEEQRKAAEAQAELAALRAEQAAREAKERAEREERERQERQKREAEEKAAREKLAAEQAEVARQQKIENDRIAAEDKRLADERAEIEREQAEAVRRNEMAMQEIQGIQHQAMIARTGRAGHVKGGTIEGVDKLLAETESWEIVPERFGVLAASAQAVKESTIANLKQYREELVREKESVAAAKRTEEADKLARKSKYPGETLIVDVLAKHFGVTEAVVRSWLIELRKAA